MPREASVSPFHTDVARTVSVVAEQHELVPLADHVGLRHVQVAAPRRQRRRSHRGYGRGITDTFGEHHVGREREPQGN